MKNYKQYIAAVLITSFFIIINLRCGIENIIASIFNGVISGTVNSGSGNLALGDASVTISSGDGDANSYIANDSTTTDANGHYQFNGITTGTKKLIFRKGIFADTIILNIQENQLYESVNANLGLSPAIKLAYLAGERDNIQQIVTQLGYPIQQIQVSDFNSLQTLQQYKYIFINSGNDSRFNLNTTQISVNISDYLKSGGMIYASDWAVECLRPIYDLPGTYTGNQQSVNNAPVIQPELNFFLDVDSVNINYNSSSWYSLDSSVECNCISTYLRGDYNINIQGITFLIEDRLLAFYNQVGVNGGGFIYTTFRNESNATPEQIKILQYFVYQLE